jgi:hypothetical protein
MTTANHVLVSSERAIENLIASYAFLNDDADITGLGELFATRTIINVGQDGRSTTSHEITNIMLDIDEVAGTAVGRAYWTVYQAVSGSPRQPILAGRYHDRFQRRDGVWRFAEWTATTLWTAAA